MTRLPQPSTTSPGFLQLVYTTNSLPHVVRQRVLSGVDITDPSVMGVEATNWLSKVIATCLPVVTFQGWKVLNPSGIELYGGTFVTGNVGTKSASGALLSDSATEDIVGRGSPAPGLAQGNTRHMIFSGEYPGGVPGPSFPIPGSGPFFDLLTFLNTSVIIGADSYGTKAVFLSKVDMQFNAHWQKKYGI